MKTTPFSCLLLVVFYLCCSLPLFAQNSRLDVSNAPKIDISRLNLMKSPDAAVKPTAATTAAKADCNNDLVAPEVHCPTGNCQPNARVAYLFSYYGQPWGQNDNIYAMSAVFGDGNWDAQYIEYADVATLLSPAYRVIFLDGSNEGTQALDAFLTANLPALENWVAAGGALFLNCAPSNAPPATINFGFGGVTLQNYHYVNQVIVQAPAHPVFNTPFVPANGDFGGSSFLHATLSGPTGLTLLTDETATGIGLSEKTWGSGKVFFGGMTMPAYHYPQPNAQNMRQNILADLNAFCSATVVVPADLNACSTIVAGQALDATATDDCTLASLTHNFTASASNTTLDAAVFPAGHTLVRWIATDATGNTSTCEFSVFVREPEVPVITCPDDITAAADPGTCEVALGFTVTATDNCPAAPKITATPASGSFFTNGTTTVQAVATDDSGNFSTCSFMVTVVPNPEICNGLDDDCNGQIDDGAVGDNLFYADADGDGYGDINNLIVDCLVPAGYVTNALDCNDNNYYVQPGMYESCNGIDDNCDGNIDEGVAPVWYADTDGDGYGDPLIMQNACNQPQGYTYNNGDCDDSNAYIHPGAQEDCTNLTDENCDGILGTNTFTIAETHTDVYCGSTPDGTINLTITPAQNYTLILWSNNVCCTTTQTNLDAGTYKVTVSNECGTTNTKTIKIKPSPTPALKVNMSGTQIKCAGDGNGSVTATVTKGCGTYTYLWNNYATTATQSGLPAGYYSVTVTDACGCTQTGSYTITEPAPLYLYTGAVIALLDGNYWIQVLPYGGTSPYKFRRTTTPGSYTSWNSSNGFANVPPGNYTFEVRDKNGCIAQLVLNLEPFSVRPRPKSSVVNTELPAQAVVPEPDSSTLDFRQLPALSVTTEEHDPEVLVFPNPTSGMLNIEWTGLEAKSASIQILNNMGQVLRTLSIPDNAMRVMTNVTELPEGIYFVKIMAEGRQIKAIRFVKS